MDNLYTKTSKPYIPTEIIEVRSKEEMDALIVDETLLGKAFYYTGENCEEYIHNTYYCVIDNTIKDGEVKDIYSKKEMDRVLRSKANIGKLFRYMGESENVSEAIENSIDDGGYMPLGYVKGEYYRATGKME